MWVLDVYGKIIASDYLESNEDMAPREEWQQLEVRTISGVGSLKFPKEDIWRAFRVFMSLLRPPRTDYRNYLKTPSKGYFCSFTSVGEDVVYDYDEMRYEREGRIYYPKGEYSFHTPFMACAFENTTDLIEEVRVALGLTPATPGDPIWLEPIKWNVTDILYTCRDETAIEIILWGIKEDVACPAGEPTPKPPPPPPSPTPPLPSDAPIDFISPPYSGDPPEWHDPSDLDEPGGYDPDTGGVIPIDEPTQECVIYEVVFSWYAPYDERRNYSSPITVFGQLFGLIIEYEDPDDDPYGATVYLDCLGIYASFRDTCGERQEAYLNFVYGIDFIIESITEYN